MRRMASFNSVTLAVLCTLACGCDQTIEDPPTINELSENDDDVGSVPSTRGAQLGAGGADAGLSGEAGASGAGGADAHVSGPALAGKTSYVKDGELFDTCGERIVLRGVNHPTLYVDREGAALPEIAKTGANAVRLFWYGTRGVSVSAAEKAVAAAIDHHMVPILAMHDSTCQWSLDPVIDAWTDPLAVKMIQRFESRLIVNIANEASAPDLTSYISGYKIAIDRLRKAGIHVPLMIDASGCGRDYDMLREAAPKLLEADPEHNLLFSAHLYNPLSAADLGKAFDAFVSAKLAFVVGEFANRQPPGCGVPLQYASLIEEADKRSIGWFAWSWGDNDPASSWNSDCAEFDMSQTFAFDSLQGWGKEVAVSLPGSLQKSAKRPQSLTLGYCAAPAGQTGTVANTGNMASKGGQAQADPRADPDHGMGHGASAAAGSGASAGMVKHPLLPGVLPQGSLGVSRPKVHMTSDKPVIGDGVGAFRTVCDFSHMNYDDPIVYPGEPGKAHLHAFFGNTEADANTTPASLKKTGNSTCRGGTLNRSAYWVPALLDPRGMPVKPDAIEVYYKSGYNGVDADEIRMFPRGLRMIAGDMRATSAQYFAYWGCRDHYIGRVGNMPDCPSGDQLAMYIEFPQCWDGKNLDSNDHKSHMAYASGGGCPSTHPVPIPAITFNVYYPISNAGSERYRLSSDTYDAALPGGYSAHGDWFEAWSTQVVLVFTNNCIRKGLDCHSHLIGDGRAMD